MAEQFLINVRESMAPGDALLLSADLVKEKGRMLAAYNDALGVTAAFNLNLLSRINRELGATFDLTKFQHEVRYDNAAQRIEMHLRSTAAQSVSIKGNFTIRLKKDETIWTESSYKFHSGQIQIMAERAGFACEAQWLDQEWPFAQSLLRVR